MQTEILLLIGALIYISGEYPSLKETNEILFENENISETSMLDVRVWNSRRNPIKNYQKSSLRKVSTNQAAPKMKNKIATNKKVNSAKNAKNNVETGGRKVANNVGKNQKKMTNNWRKGSNEKSQVEPVRKVQYNQKNGIATGRE